MRVTRPIFYSYAAFIFQSACMFEPCRLPVLKGMYAQLRTDIVDERVSTSHDDALSIAALALQCEIGDYKAVSS